MAYGSMFTTMTATIANGASLSSVVDLAGLALVGIEMPAAWTAANLTFQAAASASANVANFYDEMGGEFTASAAASRYIKIDPADFAGIKYLKVRSGTSGAPVAQGADRSITLVCRSL